MSLKGKVAVVTGAGSGIGRAIALALAREGAAVCIADMDETAGRRVLGEVGAAGVRGHFVRTDVSQSGPVRAMVEETVKTLGRLDILVNNAGVQYVAPIVDYPEDRWNLLIGVMLTGTFLCTKYALPPMRANKWGRVVNIASAHGLVASPFKSAYVAAKHGIVGFTKVAAWEVADAGITVNAICPGYVRTPLVEKQIADQARVHNIPESEVVGRIMLEPHAIKRLLEPGEIAGMAVYLCSDAAAMVTGAALSIDGGWTAH
jgi:3-hydroxybutyrate dehydrogenase